MIGTLVEQFFVRDETIKKACKGYVCPLMFAADLPHETEAPQSRGYLTGGAADGAINQLSAARLINSPSGSVRSGNGIIHFVK